MWQRGDLDDALAGASPGMIPSYLPVRRSGIMRWSVRRKDDGSNQLTQPALKAQSSKSCIHPCEEDFLDLAARSGILKP